MSTADSEKIIYTMARVTKTVNRKEILKDISLSYFHGAKIGVLGLNGSGKSNFFQAILAWDGEDLGHRILLAFTP